MELFYIKYYYFIKSESFLPHPLFPPLLRRRGGRVFREEALPPLYLHSPFPSSIPKGRGSGG
jgi:hypothetical protein